MRMSCRQAVELDTRDRSQRPADDALPGTAPGKPHANGAELTAALKDGEAECLPALGLIGDHELVDRGRRPIGGCEVRGHQRSMTSFVQSHSSRASRASPQSTTRVVM